MLDGPVPFLNHEDAAVRRLAISVCVASGLDADSIAACCGLATDDEDGGVRAMAAEALGGADGGCDDALKRARDDDDPRVVEAVATTYGELGDAAAVPWLIELASADGDRASREAAVAALGAVGDESALETLLKLVASAPPQVRRRAVVALTVFDDAAVERAIRAAAKDRNPSVREAAEMVVGRQPD
ncbi:MAG: HEAT repeat domain-containing protein [Actinomycetota bacterium]|nr:HEAT repeat domain-containing protein [Actinomycetota bacterium]